MASRCPMVTAATAAVTLEDRQAELAKEIGVADPGYHGSWSSRD
jgi:hypothetical protein